MVVIKSEFALALNQVATERGISADDVVTSIEAAVLAAFKKEHQDYLEDETVSVKIDRDTGETKIIKDGKDITPPGFGRIAAQTAKQIILQKIREAEKKNVVKHYQSQVGMIIKGRIIRFDGLNAYLDIGRAEAVLPREEQIKQEKYTVNNSLIVYLKEIVEDKFGNPRIIVSRSSPELIKQLFKREVPEVAQGTVEIKKVVREPGERAKIAVYSGQSGVDPVGACVGQKGIRVQTVTSELGGNEKIDIIQWNSDDKLFIASALSPAAVAQIEITDKSKRAKVFVDETQAPLAIGKMGVNVNLASALTGYEIDIVQTPKQAPEEKPAIVEETATREEKVEEKKEEKN